jgi:hypothetical protein
MRQIHTPCVSKCALDATKTYCIGCKRTKEELFNWASYSEAEQLAKIEELKTRVPVRS